MNFDELFRRHDEVGEKLRDALTSMGEINRAIGEGIEAQTKAILDADTPMTFEKVSEAERFYHDIQEKRNALRHVGLGQAHKTRNFTVQSMIDKAVGTMDPAFAGYRVATIDDVRYVVPTISFSSSVEWGDDESEEIDAEDYDIFEYGSLSDIDFHRTIAVVEEYFAQLVEAGAEQISLEFNDPFRWYDDYYYGYYADLDAKTMLWEVGTRSRSEVVCAKNLTSLDEVFDKVGQLLLGTKPMSQADSNQPSNEQETHDQS